MNHHRQIYDWLKNNPAHAISIAYDAITDLYIPEGEEMVLRESDDFPSGADYIDRVCASLESHGIKPLIDKLQAESDSLEGE